MIGNIFKEIGEIVKDSPLHTLSEGYPLPKPEVFDEPIETNSLYAKEASGEGMSDDKKDELKKETGWSDKVLDNIRTEDEAEVYKNAQLECTEVDGKDALTRTDIDYDLEVDGETNLDRMRQGKCPRTADGENVELHHIGQNPDAPLAELTSTEHRGPDNDMTLHDKTQESKIDRNAFRQQREEYWKARAEAIDKRRLQDNNQ